MRSYLAFLKGEYIIICWAFNKEKNRCKQFIISYYKIIYFLVQKIIHNNVIRQFIVTNTEWPAKINPKEIYFLHKYVHFAMKFHHRNLSMLIISKEIYLWWPKTICSKMKLFETNTYRCKLYYIKEKKNYNIIHSNQYDIQSLKSRVMPSNLR